MLSRRDNLLIRPWQELRYRNHRKKVQAALPAIDNAPPPNREHVMFKLKRSQKEAERCSQIMADNFTLLQHLSKIMSTTRINNAWDEPPPNFLNRVGIYSSRKKKSKLRNTETGQEEEQKDKSEPKTRKEKCYGCSPQRYVSKVEIPEIRIPFEPPKERVSKRKSSLFDMLTSRSDFDLTKTQETNKYDDLRKLNKKERSSIRLKSNGYRRKKNFSGEAQNIMLTHDDLTVKVSFPSKSEIEVTRAGVKKIIQKEFCECKAFPRLKRK